MVYLLDTTYILPFFGINIKIKNIIDILSYITQNDSDNFMITSCSLIEAKWERSGSDSPPTRAYTTTW